MVKNGDNLGDIADWFDVPVGDIKSWNKLRKNAVKYGQKLTIWVDGNKIGYYKKVNKMTASQKKKIKKIFILAVSLKNRGGRDFLKNYSLNKKVYRFLKKIKF